MCLSQDIWMVGYPVLFCPWPVMYVTPKLIWVTTPMTSVRVLKDRSCLLPGYTHPLLDWCSQGQELSVTRLHPSPSGLVFSRTGAACYQVTPIPFWIGVLNKPMFTVWCKRKLDRILFQTCFLAAREEYCFLNLVTDFDWIGAHNMLLSYWSGVLKLAS
jgi:hypothetical protein